MASALGAHTHAHSAFTSLITFFMTFFTRITIFHHDHYLLNNESMMSNAPTQISESSSGWILYMGFLPEAFWPPPKSRELGNKLFNNWIRRDMHETHILMCAESPNLVLRFFDAVDV
jgi:hypothetical protein